MADMLRRVSASVQQAQDTVHRVSVSGPRPLGDQDFARRSLQHESFVEDNKLGRVSGAGLEQLQDDGVERSG